MIDEVITGLPVIATEHDGAWWGHYRKVMIKLGGNTNR